MKPCIIAGVMDKTAQIRWDDISFVLAVIDQGSVAAAARALGVNHATVLRRIAEFEARTGVRLFNKTTRGYRISPDRRDIVQSMRQAADALGAVERMVGGARPHLKNVLRITTTDTLAQYILPSLLKQYWEVSGTPVALVVDNAHVDLTRLHAQLTVRPAMNLPPELEGTQAGMLHFGVFATEGTDPNDWLGLSGPLSRSNAARYTREVAPTPVAFCDSFPALAGMAAAGYGRAVLPLYIGRGWPTLRCIDRPDSLAPVPVWVGAHRDFARTIAIKRARSFLADALPDALRIAQDQ